jgi:phage-related protein
MWNGLKEAWPELVENAKEFVEELPDKLIEALSDIGEVGTQIIEGIWSGITDGWSWLTNKVASFASSLLESAKSALGIHSPSKEFAWVGEMITEGLGEGLEDVAPVEDAMDELIGLTTGTLTADVLMGDVKSIDSGVNGAARVFNNAFTINAAEGQDVLEIANAVKDILNDEFDETEAVFA